jgi:hypothetical protein
MLIQTILNPRRGMLLVGLFLLTATLPNPLQTSIHASAQSRKRAPSREQVDVSVLEAYLTYMQAHHLRSDEVCFYQISPLSKIRKRVLRSLQQRLARNVPPVLSADYRVQYRMGYRDRKTKRAAITYNVYGLKWSRNSIAEVDGGWKRGGLSGIKAFYTIVRKGKRWIVTNEMRYAQY